MQGRQQPVLLRDCGRHLPPTRAAGGGRKCGMFARPVRVEAAAAARYATGLDSRTRARRLPHDNLTLDEYTTKHKILPLTAPCNGVWTDSGTYPCSYTRARGCTRLPQLSPSKGAGVKPGSANGPGLLRHLIPPQPRVLLIPQLSFALNLAPLGAEDALD